MKALVYTRPRIKSFFHALVNEMDIIDSAEFMSDHKGLEDISIMDRFYKYLAKPEKADSVYNISDDEYNDIIHRCRYLRYIDKEQSRLFIRAMWSAAENIIREVSPDIIFGMVMDSYVLDVFDRVARLHGLEYSGFLNNMVNGYSRITSRGELKFYRHVDAGEVEKAKKNLVKDSYSPNMQNDFAWNISPVSMFFTKYIKEKLKIGFYTSAKIVKNDPYNFYYNTVASKNCMACRKLSFINIWKYNNDSFDQQINKAKDSDSIIIYLPLQFYPECSIDYWGTDSEMSNFYLVLDKILESVNEKCYLLVKEHPSAIGLRNPEIYKKLVDNPRVIFAPFDSSSNEMIKICDVALTWTGSVGFEAAIRGKPLITLGNAYYDTGNYFREITQIEELGKLPEIAEEILRNKSNSLDEKGQNKILQTMLQGLVPGYTFPLDYKIKPNDKELKFLASNLSEFFKSDSANMNQLRKGSL